MTFLTQNLKQTNQAVAAAALSAALLLAGMPAYAQYAEYKDYHDAGYDHYKYMDRGADSHGFYDYYNYDNWGTKSHLYDSRIYGDERFGGHADVKNSLGTGIYENDHWGAGYRRGMSLAQESRDYRTK